MGVINPGGSSSGTVASPLNVGVGAGPSVINLSDGSLTKQAGSPFVLNSDLAIQFNDTTIAHAAAGVLTMPRLRSQAANEAAAATAGAGAAPPGTVQGYLIVQDSGGVNRKVPYYAN